MRRRGPVPIAENISANLVISSPVGFGACFHHSTLIEIVWARVRGLLSGEVRGSEQAAAGGDAPIAGAAHHVLIVYLCAATDPAVW